MAAFDAGGKAGHAIVRVRVADINDNRPKFLLAEYTANIPANHSVGQSFVRVQATDPDADDSGKVTYSIYESNGTRASEVFDINANSGDLFLKTSAVGLGKQIEMIFMEISHP